MWLMLVITVLLDGYVVNADDTVLLDGYVVNAGDSCLVGWLCG